MILGLSSLLAPLRTLGDSRTLQTLQQALPLTKERPLPAPAYQVPHSQAEHAASAQPRTVSSPAPPPRSPARACPGGSRWCGGQVGVHRESPSVHKTLDREEPPQCQGVCAQLSGPTSQPSLLGRWCRAAWPPVSCWPRSKVSPETGGSRAERSAAPGPSEVAGTSVLGMDRSCPHKADFCF